MELVAKFISEEASIITLEIYKNLPTAFQAWKKTTTSWSSWSSSSPRTRTLTSRPRWPWTEASTLAKDRHQEPGRKDQLTKVELKTQFSRWFKDIYFDKKICPRQVPIMWFWHCANWSTDNVSPYNSSRLTLLGHKWLSDNDERESGVGPFSGKRYIHLKRPWPRWWMIGYG